MTAGGINDSIRSGYGVRQTQTIYAGGQAASVRTEAAPGQEAQSGEAVKNSGPAADKESGQENTAGRMSDLANVSLTFNREDDFGYIGKDSDPEALDMQKAISDMRKDQVLQSYQYFVGSAGNLFDGQPSLDGMVIMKS